MSTANRRPTGSVISGTGQQSPLPRWTAFRAVARSVARTLPLLARRRMHLPREHVGLVVRFADGTSARVYRETRMDGVPATDRCALVVAFRLRLVRGRGHPVFRWESLLNTPLFVGFPGLVSKLWLQHDDRGRYRGVYEWEGPRDAERYARSLWQVLALVSVPGSIRYVVLPGARRDALVASAYGDAAGESVDWWRPVGAA